MLHYVGGAATASLMCSTGACPCMLRRSESFFRARIPSKQLDNRKRHI